MSNLFLELLQIALSTRDSLSRKPNAEEWDDIFRIAEEQAVVGLLLTGLERLPADLLPPLELKLQWIGEAQMIEARNKQMNAAVVHLCQEMKAAGIRIFVFKGQTLAPLYPNPLLRQSGDVDYYCPPEDWGKALQRLHEKWDVDPYELNTEKDVEFEHEDIAYEMHNRLTLLMNRKHSKYWEEVVMSEIMANPYTVEIDGYPVPTLSPLHNVLYVFVHIYQHLISDGIGLRQFVDWMQVLSSVSLEPTNVVRLNQHLEGIGMRRAFAGLGAVLTDYLGLSEAMFPFVIHEPAKALMENILEYGNFGQNKEYTQNSGVLHGMEHLCRIARQSLRFGHYAPKEAWGRIPYMFCWWGKKIGMKMREKKKD